MSAADRHRRGDFRTTTEQGYGWEHQKLRRRVAVLVRSGRASCARCGLAIAPGDPWDLDHDDADRSRYLGPSHSGCNRGAAGNGAANVANAAPRRVPTAEVDPFVERMRREGWRSWWSQHWGDPQPDVYCPCSGCQYRPTPADLTSNGRTA